MIQFENIKKTFGNNEVLKGVSGEFTKGKTNLIIGSSGTGKSVLLKCIVGLIPPDEGQVIYDGRNFTHGSKNEKRSTRRDIGMLFQGSALFDSKTVEQNVMFPLDMLTKMKRPEKLDRVNYVLDRVGLAGSNAKFPAELSGGMKKRVGIARAIANDIKYLFCDEPNSGLDPQTAVVIDELIHEITVELDITTVVVTHDMNSVIGIGEQIMFLYKGLKLWEGHKDELTHSQVKEFNEFVYANKLMKYMDDAESGK